MNDRPLRIDVAARPLGATKAEGFRNKRKYLSVPDTKNLQKIFSS